MRSLSILLLAWTGIQLKLGLTGRLVEAKSFSARQAILPSQVSGDAQATSYFFCGNEFLCLRTQEVISLCEIPAQPSWLSKLG